MPRDDADHAFLWDMIEAARSIEMLVSGISFEQFRADRRTYRAVERELEILGEAAKKVSQPFRAAHPEIPWNSIIGQRNILAHEYGNIRYDLLWETVVQSLPTLIGQLNNLMPAPPPDPEPEP
ncbi:MAG: DUF86 domain-containing protein [Thermoguttaceae bacterium]|jgi:uncharacterized protein with HEPN domain